MVTGGTPTPTLSDEDIHTRRKEVVEFWEWACGAPETDHVGEFHPRYIIVTGGRDPGPGYSSCADLGHAGYWAIGCRESWVNHAEQPGGFIYGVNIWRIVSVSKPWVRQELESGDLIICSNKWPDDGSGGSHAVCVIDQPNEHTILTAEYGQPGGALKEHDISKGRIGSKTIRTVLSFEERLRKAFTKGQLVEPRAPEGLNW